MKVIELKEFSLDGPTLTERPQPKPGPGEVLVRMHAASLNYRDVLIARGLYPEPLQLPLVPVSDGAGEVVDLGPGVKRLARGDKVTTQMSSSGFRANPAMRCMPTTSAGRSTASCVITRCSPTTVW